MIEQDSGVESAGPNLRDYLGVLRRRKNVVIACVVTVVGFAIGFSVIQTPIYQGTAEVLLKTDSSQSLFDPNTGQPNDPTRVVDTEIRVLRSEAVRDAVRAKLGAAPPVSANAVGQTNVIQVKAQSAVPRKASEIANAYANSYVDFTRQQAVNDLLAAANQIEAQITDLQKQIDSLNAQVANAPSAQKQAVEQTISSQRDALIQQQALFKQKQDQLQVESALGTGSASVVNSAPIPTSPIKPRIKRNAAAAVLGGLVLGIAIAFIRDHLDDSIKNKEDLERVTDGVPALGLIPMVQSWKTRELPQVVSLADPNSSVSEAYRSMRTAVQFMGLDRPMNTLQVTSPSAAEGKTTTLANLAVTLARAGQRVVMVDCDLRRPRIHEFFGVKNDVGFTSVLLGEVPLSEAVQEVPGERLMMILASGMLPPNPSELLASQRTVQILAALQSEADVVLIDSPPVLPVTDAAVLSARVDATLLVARAGSTSRRELGRAIELLRQVDAPLVGTVMNGVTDGSAYGYVYGYRYYAREPGRRPVPAPDKR